QRCADRNRHGLGDSPYRQLPRDRVLRLSLLLNPRGLEPHGRVLLDVQLSLRLHRRLNLLPLLLAEGRGKPIFLAHYRLIRLEGGSLHLHDDRGGRRISRIELNLSFIRCSPNHMVMRPRHAYPSLEKLDDNFALGWVDFVYHCWISLTGEG